MDNKEQECCCLSSGSGNESVSSAIESDDRRILAQNTVTCCRRLSRDCFGDVLHNIFAKERLDDDHCTNSSRAHELGYTWIH